jgi:hypothetical protein
MPRNRPPVAQQHILDHLATTPPGEWVALTEISATYRPHGRSRSDSPASREHRTILTAARTLANLGTIECHVDASPRRPGEMTRALRHGPSEHPRPSRVPEPPPPGFTPPPRPYNAYRRATTYVRAAPTP